MSSCRCCPRSTSLFRAARGTVLLVDREARRFVSGAVFLGLQARAAALLEQFHALNPAREGMAREELKQKLSVPHERTFARLLAGLVEQGRIEAGDVVRL